MPKNETLGDYFRERAAKGLSNIVSFKWRNRPDLSFLPTKPAWYWCAGELTRLPGIFCVSLTRWPDRCCSLQFDWAYSNKQKKHRSVLVIFRLNPQNRFRLERSILL
jgi:hypothetical protein